MKAPRALEIILKGLMVSGGVAIAATSPYFLSRILPKIIKHAKYEVKKREKIKAFQKSFYYLKNQGMVNVEYRGKQIHINLTEEGKKKLRKYDIDALRIEKPKKWDKRWRVLIFDIVDRHKQKREALRGKIKELGLFQLQKSVWVCPYEFQKEMEILRNFFQLSKNEMKVIIASEIEDDEKIKKFFHIA
ncbi:MAG: hypothetical protein WC120_02070 [Parcubacteria group bacterium]